MGCTGLLGNAANADASWSSGPYTTPPFQLTFEQSSPLRRSASSL